jgi:hypothetical protein
MFFLKNSNFIIRLLETSPMDQANDPGLQSGRSEDEPRLERKMLNSDAQMSSDRSEIARVGDDPDDTSQKSFINADSPSRSDAEESSKEDDDSEFLDDEYDADDWPKIVISKAEKGLYEWGFKKTCFGEFGDDQKAAARFRELLSLFDLEEAPLEVSAGTFKSIKFVWCSCKDNGYLKLVSTTNPISGQDGNFYTDMELSKFYNRDYPTFLSRGYLGYSGVESDSAELLREFVLKYRELAADIKEESNGRVYI